MITRTGTTVGPPFFGFFHDYTGSYILSFGVFIAALLLSALLVLAVASPAQGGFRSRRRDLPGDAMTASIQPAVGRGRKPLR